MASAFIQKLEARYVIVESDKIEITAANLDKLKNFMKKAIIPSLMLLGPVACGQQHADKKTEQKVEQNMNSKLEQTMKGLECDVQIDSEGGSTVTFLGKINDPDSGKVISDKVIISFESHRDEIVNVEVEKPAKTERMQLFQSSLLQALKDSGREALDKYNCTYKLPAVNPVTN